MSSSIALWPACHHGTIIENCSPGIAHLAYENNFPRALLMVSRDLGQKNNTKIHSNILGKLWAVVSPFYSFLQDRKPMGSYTLHHWYGGELGSSVTAKNKAELRGQT